MTKLNAKYAFTEYFLKYNHSLDQIIKEYKYRLTLHKAGFKDMEDIVNISMGAFDESYEGAKSLAEGSLRAENRQLFLGEIGGKFMGKGVICF
jgi:hypothetical protein